MSNKKKVIYATCALGLLGIGWFIGQTVQRPVVTEEKRNLTDEALLALLKNDLVAFESVVDAGVDMHGKLPTIDGQQYTVAEGLAYFERPNFIVYLQSKQVPFIKQENGKQDVLSLSIPKNNPELLELLIKEKPKLDHTYGKKQWTLLHLASAQCSHKLTQILHEQGKLNWDKRAKDGATPLTLAAENECLPMLGYWKDQNADFKKKDGRGLSALAILQKKKSAALVAFVEALLPRKPAAVVAELDFYRKRKIPKDKLADHSAIVEPEIRPLESIETADISEFSD